MVGSRITLFFLPLLASVGSVQGYYSVMKENYTPSNFFSKFNFFTGNDPTGGFVQYVDQGTAQSKGYISSSSGSVYIGVDHTNTAPNGRQSVRLESKTVFQRGLFILDASHMPAGCGTWPAFWTLGPNWPANGEIDILEGADLNNFNSISLHTNDGCTMSGAGGTGSVISTNCLSPGADNANTGCGMRDYRTNSYGYGFNNGGGGVYAMEWNSAFIKVWFFPRGAIPADALGNYPAPENWGTPAAIFQGCDVNSHFNNHQIIFDNTFCGSWAGGIWPVSGCQGLAGSCNDYVANNPGGFSEAYWRINSLRVWSF